MKEILCCSLKHFILFSTICICSLVVIAQHDTLHANKPVSNINMAYDSYNQLKQFLLSEKNNSGIYSLKIRYQWNSKLYNDLYNQQLEISKKKELYPTLGFDSRFISHSYVVRPGSQNYIWVSTQPDYKNLGEQIAGDIMSSVFTGIISSKKKQRFNNSQKGYYTPAGKKY